MESGGERGRADALELTARRDRDSRQCLALFAATEQFVVGVERSDLPNQSDDEFEHDHSRRWCSSRLERRRPRNRCDRGSVVDRRPTDPILEQWRWHDRSLEHEQRGVGGRPRDHR